MATPLPDLQKRLDLMELAQFSRIKLLAVDLDGTLIGSKDSNVWDRILWLLNSIQSHNKNFKMIIATGRTLTGAKNSIERLYEKRRLPIILFNGGLVLRAGGYTVMYKKTISLSILDHIIRELLDFDITIFSYHYVDNSEKIFDGEISNEYVLGWTKNTQFEFEFNKMKVIWDVKDHHKDFEPTAILIDISKENREQAMKILELLSKLDGISVTSSGFSYIEIRPSNSDKARALEFVAGHLGINREEILAIGDNDNDSEMLSWAGIGVCISKASAKAVNSSKYQCKHDVASGIIEVLNLIKSAKRYSGINHEKNS